MELLLIELLLVKLEEMGLYLLLLLLLIAPAD